MNAAPSAEPPSFVRKQYEFAANIRDPESCATPGDVEERRMAIYRELFFNNIEGFLASHLPVLKSLFAETAWHAIVRDFMIRHRCRSPYFFEIAREFIDYLQQERSPEVGDPPFLQELAHYEWVELALNFSDADLDAPPADPNGDLFAGVPVLSPLAWNLSYAYPVHRIGPDFQPREPGAQRTHLVVYRNRKDAVQFLEINAVTQRLFELVKENPSLTGLELITQIADELNHPQPQAVIEHGRGLLQDLRLRDIILGTRP